MVSSFLFIYFFFYLFFSLCYGNNNSTHHFSVILEFWDVNTFVFKRTSGTGYMLYNYHLFSTFLLFSFSSIPLLCLPLLLPCCNLLFFFCPFPFHGQSWWFILNYQPKQNKTKNPKTSVFSMIHMVQNEFSSFFLPQPHSQIS